MWTYLIVFKQEDDWYKKDVFNSVKKIDKSLNMIKIIYLPSSTIN